MLLNKKVLLFFISVFIKVSLHAQCAMCKATLEADLANGGETAKGINNGILYLMIVPYIIVAVVGYFIYKHYRNSDKTAELH